MKLRFGLDPAAFDGVRARLDARCVEPPTGRRISDVYMDTPDNDLASHGVALRYRRRTALDVARRKPWRRQELRDDGRPSIGKRGIKRLKQRLDASFAVRVERWTWRSDGGHVEGGRLGDDRLRVSLDQGRITTGSAEEAFTELRVACRKRLGEAARRLAVDLGVTSVATTKVRERGLALLKASAEPVSPS